MCILITLRLPGRTGTHIRLAILDVHHMWCIQTGGVDTRYIQTGGVDTRYIQTGGVDTRCIQTGGVDTRYIQTGGVDTRYIQTGGVEEYLPISAQ